jgi:hypothetical protein
MNFRLSLDIFPRKRGLPAGAIADKEAFSTPSGWLSVTGEEAGRHPRKLDYHR